MDGFGQAALGLYCIRNADRADEWIEICDLRDSGDQLAQTKERIALARRHEINAVRLAERYGVHPVNDLAHHLGQIARDEHAVLPPLRHKLGGDLLAFSLGKASD